MPSVADDLSRKSASKKCKQAVAKQPTGSERTGCLTRAEHPGLPIAACSPPESTCALPLALGNRALALDPCTWAAASIAKAHTSVSLASGDGGLGKRSSGRRQADELARAPRRGPSQLAVPLHLLASSTLGCARAMPQVLEGHQASGVRVNSLWGEVEPRERR